MTTMETTITPATDAPAGVLPASCCTGTGCGKPMRRRGIAKSLAPDTVAEGHGGRCKTCCNADRKAAKAREQIALVPDLVEEAEETGVKEAAEKHLMAVAGLSYYFASRGRRGDFAARIHQALPQARQAYWGAAA